MEYSCSPEEAALLIGLARQFDVMLKNETAPTWENFKKSFAWLHMQRGLNFNQRVMAQGLWKRLYEGMLEANAAPENKKPG
jgi:hypothetical protein